jgi:hypothetical protein
MRTRLTAALVFAALVLPSAALAQTPGDDTYDPDPTHSSSQGSVPFTGLELALTVLVAVALVGTGFAIRTASRPRADDS